MSYTRKEKEIINNIFLGVFCMGKLRNLDCDKEYCPYSDPSGCHVALKDLTDEHYDYMVAELEKEKNSNG